MMTCHLPPPRSQGSMMNGRLMRLSHSRDVFPGVVSPARERFIAAWKAPSRSICITVIFPTHPSFCLSQRVFVADPDFSFYFIFRSLFSVPGPFRFCFFRLFSL